MRGENRPLKNRSPSVALRAPFGGLFLSGVSRRSGVLSVEATYHEVFAPRVSFIIESTRIILPSLELKEATVWKAVAYISAHAKEDDPNKKGVNVTVRPNPDTALPITLSLKDVTVGEALKLVAQLSNAKLSGHKNTFSLGNLPFALPVADKPGFVASPYKPGGLVDVRGLRKGTEVECPYKRIPFLVP